MVIFFSFIKQSQATFWLANFNKTKCNKTKNKTWWAWQWATMFTTRTATEAQKWNQFHSLYFATEVWECLHNASLDHKVWRCLVLIYDFQLACRALTLKALTLCLYLILCMPAEDLTIGPVSTQNLFNRRLRRFTGKSLKMMREVLWSHKTFLLSIHFPPSYLICISFFPRCFSLPLLFQSILCLFALVSSHFLPVLLTPATVATLTIHDAGVRRQILSYPFLCLMELRLASVDPLTVCGGVRGHGCSICVTFSPCRLFVLC